MLKNIFFYKLILTATYAEDLSSIYEKTIKANCVILRVSLSSYELSIAPNPTQQMIDIFPLNDLTNKLLKASLNYATGGIIMNKEAIMPILDAKLIAAESGMYLLKISNDGLSKTFKVMKD